MNNWIVIPAHNEEQCISPVLRNVLKNHKNVVVVDDGSTDNTATVARKNGVTVLKHIINMGKGAALKTGCDYVQQKGAENIVVMDADGQHNPKDIPRFLKKLNSYDIVYSYRRLNKRMPGILRLGNKIISSIVSLLYNVKLKDTQCGFRAFRQSTYPLIRWDANDYSMESEMIARAGKYKLQYTEIPIHTVYADKYKGTTVIDGIKIVVGLVLRKLKRFN